MINFVIIPDSVVQRRWLLCRSPVFLYSYIHFSHRSRPTRQPPGHYGAEFQSDTMKREQCYNSSHATTENRPWIIAQFGSHWGAQCVKSICLFAPPDISTKVEIATIIYLGVHASSAAAHLLRKYAPDVQTALTIYHVFLQDLQTSKPISSRDRLRSWWAPNFHFFFLWLPFSTFALPVAETLIRRRVDFRCGFPWLPTLPNWLLLLFPSPSWIADAGLRISPNSSPIKSRTTSAINHLPPSFRFRWKDTTQHLSKAPI